MEGGGAREEERIDSLERLISREASRENRELPSNMPLRYRELICP